MGALISYLLLALVVSFICSLTESVLLSTPKTFLMSVKEKEKWAHSFIKMKSNIDRPLSAILSLNTIAHTIGAAGVGVEATKEFGDASLGIVSAIMTILILVITEIIPKTIGAKYWKSLAKLTLQTINIMIFLTYPLVILSTKITKIISGDKKEETTSREEIAALADIGTNQGVFSKYENKIIQNILKLKKIKVTEIMTPRVVVTSVNENLEIEEFKKNKKFLNFSRIPTYDTENEKITGYIFLQDILEKLSEKKDNSLLIKEFKRDILTIPSSITIFSLWEKILEKKEHIAIVIDEYGGLDGVVTMEDIIETFIGLEITDENDEIIDMRKYAKKRWEKRQKKQNRFNNI